MSCSDTTFIWVQVIHACSHGLRHIVLLAPQHPSPPTLARLSALLRSRTPLPSANPPTLKLAIISNTCLGSVSDIQQAVAEATQNALLGAVLFDPFPDRPLPSQPGKSQAPAAGAGLATSSTRDADVAGAGKVPPAASCREIAWQVAGLLRVGVCSLRAAAQLGQMAGEMHVLVVDGLQDDVALVSTPGSHAHLLSELKAP